LKKESMDFTLFLPTPSPHGVRTHVPAVYSARSVLPASPVCPG
jgi:hypothetical protein